MERRPSGYDQVKAKLSLQERKAYDDVLYMDYMSSEESDYEDQEDPITGENIKRLVGYATRKLPWERSRLTSLKSKLDKLHAQNLTPHARQMLRLEEEESQVGLLLRVLHGQCDSQQLMCELTLTLLVG